MGMDGQIVQIFVALLHEVATALPAGKTLDRIGSPGSPKKCGMPLKLGYMQMMEHGHPRHRHK